MARIDGGGAQWERLAQYVRDSRTQMGLSQREITERGGPSDTTLGQIEAGEWRPSRGVGRTLEKLDKGMNWLPGSASRTLSGGEPVTAGSVPAGPMVIDLSQISAEDLAAELLRRIPDDQLGGGRRPRWRDLPGSPNL